MLQGCFAQSLKKEMYKRKLNFAGEIMQMENYFTSILEISWIELLLVQGTQDRNKYSFRATEDFTCITSAKNIFLKEILSTVAR